MQECVNILGGFSMPENKPYITLNQDNGSVLISEEVVATIVVTALKDVEGVVGLGGKSGAEALVKKALGKELKIVISENNDITIDCHVVIAYGSIVLDVAKDAQDAVCSAVESMTGVKPQCVNINVCGIVRQ